MNNFLASYGKKLRDFYNQTLHFFSSSTQKLQRFCTGACLFVCFCYRDLVLRINPFIAQILYFLSVSTIGFGILTSTNPKTSFKPRNLDLFFTSVSATTVSSMSTVEMEAFSNSQLVIITILMFVGGEVFTSMIGLHLKRSKIIRTWKSEGRVTSVETEPNSPSAIDFDDQIELGIITLPDHQLEFNSRFQSQTNVLSNFKPFIKHDSVKFLGFVVLGYLLTAHIVGIASVLIYITAISSSARDVLKKKGLKVFTFAVFTVVSTFASCGFVPTNENMMVFSKNSGLLLILIPQILAGNTLFPSCLRFSIWVLGKRCKKAEAKYLLKNGGLGSIGYLHLLSGRHSIFLVGSVFGFVLMGFVVFCAMEWDFVGLNGLSGYEKTVGVLFQSVNARHTGETIVDLSAIAPAVMVFFVVMMYLPPYTSFLPLKKGEENPLMDCEGRKSMRRRVGENFILSQLSYLAIFVALICITERKSIKEDPINFSVFNIVVEVISAYGNVGFTTGYGCARQLRPDPKCVDKWYGFAGKWSDEGKLVLIIVMFFGRLKKFNMNGGQAWKLL